MDTIKNVEEKKQTDWWNILGVSLYFSIGLEILQRIFQNVFSFSFSTASTTAFLLLLFIGYPIFFRGTVNFWTKDKRNWNFQAFATFAIIFAILFFFFAKYFID